MKERVILCVLACFFLLSCEKKPPATPGRSEGRPEAKVIVEREKEERRQPLPPEVKIKLKKDGKDNYSWELNSSDADQILRENEKLKKNLGEKSNKNSEPKIK